ncbi:hypothetical protein OOU_Y34scaffold00511g8 [Pyricularia oryzae Y34]|uniref:Uncharacterized protein n=1 Tax=Pyricularia oryzae (strain Y34) TaxID=1143189 RepID=A0AA97PLW4_PYRO3|nr:hypothetical protein OOU_Y34scaffold00511g8 [Pyricularia oryzae Y34]
MPPFANLVNYTLGRKAEKGNPTDHGTPKTVTYWDEERSENRPECVKCQEILHRGPPCRCNLCGAVNLEVLSDGDASTEKAASADGGKSSSNSNTGKNKNASSSSAAKEEGRLDKDWQHVMVYRPGEEFVPKSQQQVHKNLDKNPNIKTLGKKKPSMRDL